jgi:hypothetical protein
MIYEKIADLCQEILDDLDAEGLVTSDAGDSIELFRDYISAGAEPVEAFFRLLAREGRDDAALLAELRRTPAEVREQRENCTI